MSSDLVAKSDINGAFWESKGLIGLVRPRVRFDYTGKAAGNWWERISKASPTYMFKAAGIFYDICQRTLQGRSSGQMWRRLAPMACNEPPQCQGCPCFHF